MSKVQPQHGLRPYEQQERSSERGNSLSRAVPTGYWDCTKALKTETTSDKLFTVQIDYRRLKAPEVLQAGRRNGD